MGHAASPWEGLEMVYADVHERERLRSRNAWLEAECHRLTVVNSTLADRVVSAGLVARGSMVVAVRERLFSTWPVEMGREMGGGVVWGHLVASVAVGAVLERGSDVV